MAKVLCVLYDDPVDGYPKSYPRDGLPVLDELPGRPDAPDARGDRLHPGRTARQRLGRARAAEIPGGLGPHARRHLGQGRRRLGVRARAPRRGRRDLPTVLAGVPDGGADREGAAASSSPSPPASARTTSTCRRPSSTASPSPR